MAVTLSVSHKRTMIGKRRIAIFAIFVTSCPLLTSKPLHATGFFVNQQSVQGIGQVNAGVVAGTNDASAIFFNPAALGLLQAPSREFNGYWLSAGVQTIIPRSKLTNGGSTASTPGTGFAPTGYVGNDFRNPSDPTPVPSLYLAYQWNENAFIGLGLNSPFGLASRFSDEWFGRYDSVEAELLTANLSLVGAYRIANRVWVGGGVDFQYASSKLSAAIPNPLTPGGPTPASDGFVETRGNDWTPGFNIGVVAEIDPRTRIGAHLRSPIEHDIQGSAITSRFTGPLAVANGVVDASAKLKLPLIASVGASHQFGSLTLLGQLEYYRWSTFDEIRLRFGDGRPDEVRTTGYRDSWAWALGANYRLSDALLVRGGVRLDRTPTVDAYRDTTFPDSNRVWLGSGATYKFSAHSDITVGVNYVFFDPATFDIVRAYPLAASLVRVVGKTDSKVITVSVGYNHAF